MVARIALALLLTGWTAQAGIDFTPTTVAVEFEGGHTDQPGFHDGKCMVTFAPPTGWTLEGAGPVLKLAPANASFSMARVESRALPGTAVDSEDGLKAARQYFAMLLPSDARDLKWEPEPEKNPVLFNRHESVRLDATYRAYGQALRAAVIVCNLADQQIVFVVSGREHDFGRIYGEWRRSLFTWQGFR